MSNNRVFITKIEGEAAKNLAKVFNKQYTIFGYGTKDGSVELYAED